MSCDGGANDWPRSGGISRDTYVSHETWVRRPLHDSRGAAPRCGSAPSGRRRCPRGSTARRGRQGPSSARHGGLRSRWRGYARAVTGPADLEYQPLAQLSKVGKNRRATLPRRQWVGWPVSALSLTPRAEPRQDPGRSSVRPMDRMPEPGGLITAFSPQPGRCFRVVYSVQLQADHCRQAPAWKGIWTDARGRVGRSKSCRLYAPRVTSGASERF